MKKIGFIKLIFLLMFIGLYQNYSFAQYPSLRDSPMFNNDKLNIFKDTETNILYDMSVMDSLYKTGKSPFAVLSDIKSGDSIIWMIKFINKEESSLKPQWLNKEFPLQNFVDLSNNQINKNKLTGKVIIINCWSISCGPCIKEMPYLNALMDSLDTSNYVFLGITFDDAESINHFFKSDKLKEYLNSQDPSFNFTIIPNQKVLLSSILNVKSYPTTFIVDQNGIIKEIIEGLNLDDKKNPLVLDEIMDTIRKM